MDYYLGGIVLFPYQFEPYGWVLCDGRLLNAREYPALLSLLSTKFGGDGTSTFGVPNLLGAEPIPGMKYYIATQGIYPMRD